MNLPGLLVVQVYKGRSIKQTILALELTINVKL